jgi:hypothetical protein
MTISDVIDKLKSFFKKEEVSEEITFLKEVLSNSMEEYVKAVNVLTPGLLNTNKPIKDILSKIYLNTKDSKGKTKFIEVTIDQLAEIVNNILVIEHLYKEDNSSIVIKEGISAKKLTLIKAIEYMTFCGTYSLDLLSYIYSQLSEDNNKKEYSLFTHAKVDYLKLNAINYGILMETMSDPKLKDTIDNIPDVVLNTATISSLTSVYNESQLSPLTTKISNGFIGNPILAIRLNIVEYQAKRYHYCKERKTLLGLQKLNLELELKKSPNPNLEHQIELLNDRIKSYDYEMRQIEKKAE